MSTITEVKIASSNPVEVNVDYAFEDAKFDAIVGILEEEIERTLRGKINDVFLREDVEPFKPFMVNVSFKRCEGMPFRVWHSFDYSGATVEWAAYAMPGEPWQPDGTCYRTYEVRPYDRCGW